MIEIDGSQGEGGGQVLRTALGLSALTGEAVRLEKIRAGREKPGLLRQHLTAVQAAARVCGAKVVGAGMGATELEFWPGEVVAGDFRLDIGSAGSTTLVVQTILPALLRAPGPSTVTVRGGTHNSAAPPWQFLARTFLPVLARMGATASTELVRWGFYPAGGGEITVRISPGPLQPLDLVERGALSDVAAVAVTSGRVPRHVGEREISELVRRLQLQPAQARSLEVPSAGPGNAAWIEARCEALTAVFTGFGERRVPAEAVAAGAAGEFLRWRDAGVPVDAHLADQLLIPLAMAGGGRFRTTEPSLHTTTNIAVIERFLPVKFSIEAMGGQFEIRV